MKARAGLSIVMWFLVLGAFSACQEASKHKSQSIQSTQVSASSGVPSQDSLSDNRKFSANKATQPNQVQPQQPHSDSSISASKANADSTISTSSSPDTDLSPKPKAITKKQAHDFCHSDWVKQHYLCSNKYAKCDHTQEEVIDSADPYQCKLLSPQNNLAIIIKLEDFDDERKVASNGIFSIDLIDIKRLDVLYHFIEKLDYIDAILFKSMSIYTLSNFARKNHFFGIIFNMYNDHGDSFLQKHTLNIYRYADNKIKRVLYDLNIDNLFQYQEEEMEEKLPKYIKNRCINAIEEEKTTYKWINTYVNGLPQLKLKKVIIKKWVQGRHYKVESGATPLNLSICEDKSLKIIKKSNKTVKYKVLNFDGKTYPIPGLWRSGSFRNL